MGLKMNSCFTAICMLVSLACSRALAQTAGWQNYVSGFEVTGVAEVDRYIWAGTTGGLVQVDKETNSITYFNRLNSELPQNQIYSVVASRQKTLFVLTGSKLLKIEEGFWYDIVTPADFSVQNSNRCMAVDGSGQLWIAAGTTLYKWDGTQWHFYNSSNSAMPQASLSSLMIDKEDRKWIISSAGLIFFDDQDWIVYNESNTACAEMRYPNCIAIDSSKTRWIGSINGLIRWSSSGITLLRPPYNPEIHFSVYEIEVSRDEILWIGSSIGLLRYDGLEWQQYTSINSVLPDNHITAILNGSDGTVWLGTARGLVKCSAEQWVIYNTVNSQIGGNNIRTIYEDSTSGMWFGTADGGVSNFNGTVWKNYSNKTSLLKSQDVLAVTRTNDGSFWFGSSNGLTQLKGSAWKRFDTSNSPLPSSSILFFYVDKPSTAAGEDSILVPLFSSAPEPLPRVQLAEEDKLWIGTSNGIAILDIGTMEWNIPQPNFSLGRVRALVSNSTRRMWIGGYNLFSYYAGIWSEYVPPQKTILGGINVTSLITDSDGRLLVSSADGVYHFDGIQWTRVSGALGYSGNVKSMAIDRNGTKWYATYNGGVLRQDASGTLFQYRVKNSLLPNDSVHVVRVDAENCIWIGTQQGVARLAFPGWQSFPTSQSELPDNDIGSICITPDGDKWISTVNSQGLINIGEPGWRFYDYYNSGERVDRILAAAFEPPNILWIGGRDYEQEVQSFDGTIWSSFPLVSLSASYVEVRGIAIDRSKAKWIGTDKGLVKLVNFNQIHYNTDNSGLPGNDIYAVAIDKQGNKWIATNSGLARYDDTNWIIYNSLNSPLPANYVYAIEIDRSGDKWIGTDAGLAKLSSNGWIAYPSINEGIRQIAIDSSGTVWLGTQNGLVKLSNNNITYYTQENSGLPSNDISALACDRDGTVFIGTNGGGLATFKEENSNSHILSNGELQESHQPTAIIVKQNYPNPFNLSTSVRCSLSAAAGVQATIFNTRGQCIRSLFNRTLQKGEHIFSWNGDDDAGQVLPSGIYLCHINSPEFSRWIKMALIK